MSNLGEAAKTLRALGARNPKTVLEELSALREAQDAGDPILLPLVTLHLSTGRDLTGWVISVGEERNDRFVLVHVPNDLRNPDYDAAFLPLHLVVMVTVHDAPRMGAASPDAPPAPTRLELKRTVAAAGTALTERLGTTIAFEVDATPETPDTAMRVLGQVAARSQEALGLIASDELGAAALKEKVKKVRYSSGSATDITLEAGTLQVVSGSSLVGMPTAAELKALIEAVI